MAEWTHQARIDEAIARLAHLQEAIAVLISFFESLDDSMMELKVRFQTLDAKVEQHIRRVPQPPPQFNHHHPAAPTFKMMHLDVPRFSGGNPSAWVSQIQMYFDYYLTPDTQRLTTASSLLDGDALVWYNWMSNNNLINDWPEFWRALGNQFGPSECEDPLGKLRKLVQVGTLSDYQHQFERLVPDHDALISCFVSGLKCELRKAVQVSKPVSLVQAMALARLLDEKLKGSKVATKSWVENTLYSEPPSTYKPAFPLLPLLPTTPSPPPFNSSPQNKNALPARKLTASEMMARKGKGLCYDTISPDQELGSGSVTAVDHINTVEREHALHAEFEMRGFGKEDVKVSLKRTPRGVFFFISGSDEEKGRGQMQHVLLMEITEEGRYRLDQIKTKIKNGILNVTVPKVKGS